MHHCFTYRPLSRYMLGWCYWNIFMCLTSIPIYIDPLKSFMKFGIKKSHEMTNYVLAWIGLLGEWEHVNIATLIKQLYLHSWTKVMKSSCWASGKKMHQSVWNSNLCFTVMLFWLVLTNRLHCLHGVEPKQKLKFVWSRTNFVFVPRARSACKNVKPRLKLWIYCGFQSPKNLQSLSNWKLNFQFHEPYFAAIYILI